MTSYQLRDAVVRCGMQLSAARWMHLSAADHAFEYMVLLRFSSRKGVWLRCIFVVVVRYGSVLYYRFASHRTICLYQNRTAPCIGCSKFRIRTKSRLPVDFHYRVSMETKTLTNLWGSFKARVLPRCGSVFTGLTGFHRFRPVFGEPHRTLFFP